MKFTYFLVLAILFLPIAYACQTSLDSYAVEVLLNKNANFNLNKLAMGENVIIQDDKYIIQSQYSKDLATIITKNNDNAVSIRIQIPAESREVNTQYFILLSTIQGAYNFTSKTDYFDNWFISSDSSSMVLQNKELNIRVSSLGFTHEVLVEVRNNITSCGSCDGKCFNVNLESVCITNSEKESIQEIIAYTGITRNFDSLFTNYRVIGVGEKKIDDLVSEIDSVNLKHAMNEELNWLVDNNIITLDNKDINDITNLAEQERAGNSKIVYSEETKSWIYYYQLKDAVISQELNCNEFILARMPSGLPIPAVIGISTYYLVPIVLTGTLIVILIVMVIVARLKCSVNSKNCYISLKKANKG